jgi:hypothetical protein
MSIPTYSADGKRLRDYSLSAIQSLFQQGRVTLEHGRKGRICRAYFRATDSQQNAVGTNPIVKRPHAGTHYSFVGQVGSARLWQFQELPDSREPFRAVERSVTLRRLAPVIAIDSFRKRSKRPVEFAAPPMLKRAA